MLAYVVRPTRASLIETKARNVVFPGGVLGALVGISEGKQTAQDNGLQNPANEIAPEIARAYAAAHGYRLAASPIVRDKAAGTDKTPIGELAKGATYVLDVEPPGMNLSYFPLDWSHYGLTYLDRVRVFDVASGRIIENQRCFLKPHHAPDSPSHAQLMANQAALLKRMIHDRAEECARELEGKLGAAASAG